MPTAISSATKFATNMPAINASNALVQNSNDVMSQQLALSTGKSINAPSDDLAGYITVQSVKSQNSTLKTTLNSVNEAVNVVSVAQDSINNIQDLLTQVKDNVASVASNTIEVEDKVNVEIGRAHV